MGSGKTMWRTGSSKLILKGHCDSKAPPEIALRKQEATFSEEEKNTALGSDADV